jgi:hypothetical protein
MILPDADGPGRGQQVREWYTTQEFAHAVGKAEFTIREHSRLGRLNVSKRQSGRGAYPQWVLGRQRGFRPQAGSDCPSGLCETATRLHVRTEEVELPAPAEG